MTRPPKSPDKLLARSGLGAEANAAVRATVRATRLWPKEKGDVCRELIAHFQDGREAGADEASLVRDFGDPRAAARLIRRAKRRQRPLAWHAAMWGVRGIAGVFALVLCVYAVLAWRYYSATPVIKRDYLAEINAAAAAVPESERAWPVYRETIARLNPESDAGRKDVDDLLRAEPGWERWPQLRDLVSARQQQIAALRRAAAMPRLGFVASPLMDAADAAAMGMSPGEIADAASGPLAGSVVAALLPHLSWMKSACRWLIADARVAGEAGEGARAVDDLAAALRLGAHLRENRSLITQLVSISVLGLACDEAGRLIDQHADAFADSDLKTFAHELAGVSSDLAIDLSAEKASMMDLIQRVYSDDGAGNGRLTPAWAIVWPALSVPSSNGFIDGVDAAAGPMAMALAPSRREIEAMTERVYGRLQDEARDPVISKTTDDALLQGMLEQSRGGWLLSAIIPAMSSAMRNAHEAAMRLDAAKAVVALELFRRANGVYPASLEELTPQYLPVPPIDRYDGRPLRYTLRHERPLLYSVASDRVDNLGVPPADPGMAGWGRSTPRGTDWVLYPPAPRKPRERGAEE